MPIERFTKKAANIYNRSESLIKKSIQVGDAINEGKFSNNIIKSYEKKKISRSEMLRIEQERRKQEKKKEKKILNIIPDELSVF